MALGFSGWAFGLVRVLLLVVTVTSFSVRSPQHRQQNKAWSVGNYNAQ
jgi:hypothetical protein